ncbi:MAG: hypothetical protein A2749_02310 [Parcubacteria group bacterium RIFCSPHIGHO2_01_FULL_45_26]|nr:MAG: hypothetical protein A2749_02310 [Parcubacteria group bacterium RIFCSPHIGHO2_01_FULL_45_26]
MRNIKLVTGEYYHVYNRGVDHRQIVSDNEDSRRFMLGLDFFNTTRPIGSIYEYSLLKERPTKSPLVNIIAYCLNPNHFHLILEQLEDNGISIFLKSLTGGYTKYFNNKNKRTGSLLQGTFKAKHVNDNDYLVHLSAYVNLNDKLHQLGNLVSKLVRSSFGEYTVDAKLALCKKEIILDQFKDKADYKKYCDSVLPDMIAKRADYKELEHLMFD